MQQNTGLLTFVTLAVLLSLSAADPKYYKDYFNINSRVPGDQLLWQSKDFSQNLDFFAKVHIELRYPQDLPHSNYMLTNLYVTGQDDTGYVDYKPEYGGPGSDSMRCKIVLDSIQHGYFHAFLYGKKK